MRRRDHFERVFERARLLFEFTQSVVEVAGEVAIERLAYTAVLTPRDGGAEARGSRQRNTYSSGE
jgi:hypothetical protein